MDQAEFVQELKTKIIDAVSRCRNCNSCYSVCPLYESTRGYQVQGPSGILQAIYYAIRWDELKGGEKEALRDILYACTTCYSCVLKCKSSASGVPLLDAIEGGRSLLVESMVGPMPGQRKVLKSLEQKGNPYEEAPSKRLDWLKGFEQESRLSYRLLPEQKAEILLYVGCTPSYNRDLHSVASSVVKLLEAIGANYGILREERCCGSPAKQLGDEGLFEEFSNQNLERFRESGIRKVITISPHCYHTFIHDYMEGIKEFEVQHYTQFFAEMIEKGHLSPKRKIERVVAYHDSCYLGKRNNVYEPPRKILEHIPGVKVVEMKRQRDNALCCGGGGGRVWIDVEEINRLSESRVREALDAGADTLSTACPWCHMQLEDGIKTAGCEGKVDIQDVAELLAESVERS